VGTKRYQKGTNSKATTRSTYASDPMPGSVTLETSGFSGRRSLFLIGDEKRYHRAVCAARFSVGYGLGVGFESDADRRMPHQFLHDLEFGTCSSQQLEYVLRNVMPPNPLRDAASRRHPCASLAPFTSTRVGRGLSPPSCRTCSAHKEKAARSSVRPVLRRVWTKSLLT
jgi:hypothetical protein